jgi:PKHD-type hydroxylase
MIYGFSSDPSPPNAGIKNAHFIQRDSGLTIEEINRIREIGDELETYGVSLYGGNTDEQVKATGSHFPLNDDTRWFYDRMAEWAQEFNAETYQYDLTGFHENFYYLSYDASLDEHFNWHLDIGCDTPAPRKLSLVLQLSDPSEYEGGDFDVLVSTAHHTARKQQGIITAFPSYKIHRVTPVTRGKRRTLSMFLVGPNFR